MAYQYPLTATHQCVHTFHKANTHMLQYCTQPIPYCGHMYLRVCRNETSSIYKLILLPLLPPRIRVYKAGDMVIDSGCQCNPSATGAVEGGKLGLYTFSQPAVIYSDMKYRCLDATQLDDVAHCSAHQ